MLKVFLKLKLIVIGGFFLQMVIDHYISNHYYHLAATIIALTAWVIVVSRNIDIYIEVREQRKRKGDASWE